MKLSNICLSASIVAVAMGQRRPNRKKNKNKNRKPTKPALIEVPTQPEPGLSDNRQDIANMLAFRLLYFGYNDIEFTDVLSSGCWCNMINNYDKRKGHPVGTMDTACRAHSHCYKCINMDFECTAIDSAYQVFVDPETNDFTCEKNTNPCAIRACECDVELVNNLVTTVGEEAQNIAALTEYGGFDPSTQCIAGGGGSGGKPDQCCGEYPKRFPFYSDFGARGCCAGKTFNANSLECCAGGDVKGIGTCPNGPY